MPFSEDEAEVKKAGMKIELDGIHIQLIIFVLGIQRTFFLCAKVKDSLLATAQVVQYLLNARAPPFIGGRVRI